MDERTKREMQKQVERARRARELERKREAQRRKKQG